MQHGLRLASPPDGQHECIGDQCVAMVACMDQPTTRREKRSTPLRDVEPAFGSPEIGEVIDPFAIGRRGR